ncbi:MAG TPA: Re/Si-specific NAD(P)(+) transhydrogenase subunit alpha [Polyangiales bacterium]|jgi:NAD(P) transhydrogenase subunit alpha|nr:Re/Si-specific NAD(P)(+) transhydrogenase subunit alpha [Polyangiales bacterium]
MSAQVFVAKETLAGELRVAATPETVKKLVKDGLSVAVQAGAGDGANIADALFTEAGATLAADAKAAWQAADMVLKVQPPSVEEAALLKPGAILITHVFPHKNLPAVKALADRKASTLAMDLVPRISRAQVMDSLSSQANIAGYKAVVLAASRLGKYFPLLMTAAGTIQPSKVVIMGAGVAGLQAIATARRLGALVEVSDIRPAVKEQVESLGAKFIDLPMQESGEGAGGYAKEVSAEFLAKQQAVLKEKISQADVVITTAQVPGKAAPRLVTEEMVKAMRPGSIIVDLAADSGGNCELTENNKEVVKHGVLILGHSNLPNTMPTDASLLYARNVYALIKLVNDKGTLKLNLEDEIIAGALLTTDGTVRHAPTAAALKG